MSTLLLIPWIIFGYKHPAYRFIGLCQSKKTLFVLLSLEIAYWLVLVFLTPPGNRSGEGSFAWKYILLYEKGIIPIWYLSEKFNPMIAEKIDANFKYLYLLAALVMDYVFLFIISPRVPQLLGRKKQQRSEKMKSASLTASSDKQTS